MELGSGTSGSAVCILSA